MSAYACDVSIRIPCQDTHAIVQGTACAVPCHAGALSRHACAMPCLSGLTARVRCESRLSETDVQALCGNGEQESGLRLWRDNAGVSGAGDAVCGSAADVWGEWQECIICFEPFVAGEETKKLPCLHTFHGVSPGPIRITVSLITIAMS